MCFPIGMILAADKLYDVLHFSFRLGQINRRIDFTVEQGNVNGQTLW